MATRYRVRVKHEHGHPFKRNGVMFDMAFRDIDTAELGWTPEQIENLKQTPVLEIEEVTADEKPEEDTDPGLASRRKRRR